MRDKLTIAVLGFYILITAAVWGKTVGYKFVWDDALKKALSYGYEGVTRQ